MEKHVIIQYSSLEKPKIVFETSFIQDIDVMLMRFNINNNFNTGIRKYTYKSESYKLS